MRVAAGATRLVVKLAARVPKPSGRGTREVAVGGLTKRVSAGTAKLRVKLTASARRRLRGLPKVTLGSRSPPARPRAKSKRLRGSAI